VLIANGISVFADAQLRGLDITPFAFTVSGVFIATGLFRYGLLEQPPIDNQTIIDNIPDPLLVINENRRILYMNHAFEKLAGLTPGTSIKQPVRDVLPNWPDIFTICQYKLRQEITTDDGKQALALEVQISPLYEGKTQVGCAYTFRDISPTRKAEEPVTRRSIGAEPANLPILVITDAENGAILDVNSEFIFQTGYSREETIGRTLREVGLLDTQTSLALNIMVEKRGSLENEELTVADKNGQGRRWQFSMTPNSLAGQKIIVWAAQLVV
jgi:PAS domain S-box-containing protein